MALSDYERQMLEELEAQLADEDPSFAKTMKPASVSPALQRQVSLRHIVLGTLIAVAGITLLVFSITLSFVPLGVLGVFVMGVGFWYASSPAGSVTVPTPDAEQTKRADTQKVSFMERQEQRWNKRQD